MVFGQQIANALVARRMKSFIGRYAVRLNADHHPDSLTFLLGAQRPSERSYGNAEHEQYKHNSFHPFAPVKLNAGRRLLLPQLRGEVAGQPPVPHLEVLESDLQCRRLFAYTEVVMRR